MNVISAVRQESVNILEAMSDPALFGGLFDTDSWAAWRIFLAALFGLPMTEAEAERFREHNGRITLPAAQFREGALICGRRGGRSRVLALIAVFLAAFRDHSASIAPGEVPVVAVIAADRKQARIILRYIGGIIKLVPMLSAMIVEELAESLLLTNGVSIVVSTNGIGAPRGRTYIAVIGDECAFWMSAEDGANPDAEVINAVRPCLSSIPGSSY